MVNEPITEEYDDLFKVMLNGDSGCGKSGLLDQFINGTFQTSYTGTLGVDFGTKIVQVGSRRAKLHLWDTGGQERYSFVRPLYYKDAQGAILVFDVSNRESFDHLPNWIEEIELNAGKIPVVLVGNKIDCSRIVSFEDAWTFCMELNLPFYYESSAKNGIVIDEIFQGITCLMMNDSHACEKEAARLKAEYKTTFEAWEKAEYEASEKAERKAQDQAERKRAAAEQERMDKLRRIMKVSTSLEIAQLASLLGIDEKDLMDRIIDWAEQFGFQIDGNKVIFGQGNTAAFIDELNAAFGSWGGKEKNKDGKLE